MEREPPGVSLSVSREASEWFVFLQDDPDDASLRLRFERWLSADPTHGAAWAETLRAASVSESLLPFDAQHWRAVEPNVSPVVAPRALSRPRWAASAGAFAIAASIAFLAAPALLLRLNADFQTGTAEIRQIDLKDGSTVTMAPGSAIAVAYSAGHREVRLLAGEAYFAVEPDANRPFTVKAQALTASVLGTSFDVDIQKDAVAVSVTEGRVKVEGGQTSEVLQAGQAIRIASQPPVVDRTAPSTIAASAWRRGQLVMEDRPFGDAVAYLQRYYGGSIVIVGSALQDRPVTGIFDLNDPEGALRTMAKALDVKVRRVSPWLLLVSGS